MFGDCNDTWEHCVMPGEIDGIDMFDAPRASVVFKRSLAVGKGGGTRGHAVTTRVTAPRGAGAGNRNRRGGGSNPGGGGAVPVVVRGPASRVGRRAPKRGPRAVPRGRRVVVVGGVVSRRSGPYPLPPALRLAREPRVRALRRRQGGAADARAR